jgi:antitoxin YefM
MTAVPLDRDGEKDVRALAARARETHEPVQLLEGDRPVAFLVGAEEYEGLLETLDILSNPGELEDIRASREEFARGEGIDGPSALAPFLSRSPRTRPE